MIARLALLVAGVLCGLAAGCAEPCPKTALGLDQLVGRYNANASAIPKLYAQVRMSVQLADDKGRTFLWGSTISISPNGTLLLGKADNPLGPHNFLLMGREAGRTLFQMGSNVEQEYAGVTGLYYLWYNVADRNGAWWGSLALAGAEGVDIPLDPTQLAAVLGVIELPSDFTKLPTVALTLQADQDRSLCKPCQCAYVVTYIDRQPVSNRILFKREILFRWSDKEPARPFQVNLISPQGRRIMTATLKDYRQIDTGEEGPAPEMPTNIEIVWPQTSNRIHLVLSEMNAHQGRAEQAVFDPPTANVNRVDAGIGQGGAK